MIIYRLAKQILCFATLPLGYIMCVYTKTYICIYAYMYVSIYVYKGFVVSIINPLVLPKILPTSDHVL